MKESIVLAYGIFDSKKKAHKTYLEHAKSYGDKLVVIVATDENIKKLLGITPKYQQNQRFEYIKSLNIADQVELGNDSSYFKTISYYKPDMVVLQS
ncbi:MAG: adenylyltransferase/cytidyltransferase family protein [bacterium]|nr:adenylyltransferase/cytidyltransferase family protein [bacterium]